MVKTCKCIHECSNSNWHLKMKKKIHSEGNKKYFDSFQLLTDYKVTLACLLLMWMHKKTKQKSLKRGVVHKAALQWIFTLRESPEALEPKGPFASSSSNQVPSSNDLVPELAFGFMLCHFKKRRNISFPGLLSSLFSIVF